MSAKFKELIPVHLQEKKEFTKEDFDKLLEEESAMNERLYNHSKIEDFRIRFDFPIYEKSTIISDIVTDSSIKEHLLTSINKGSINLQIFVNGNPTIIGKSLLDMAVITISRID